MVQRYVALEQWILKWNSSHGIVIPLPMVFWSPTHGISNPLSMVYWTTYSWYLDPLFMVFSASSHGILTSLFIVYWTPTHGILNPYPWYIEPPIHDILNPLPMVYRHPPMVFWLHKHVITHVSSKWKDTLQIYGHKLYSSSRRLVPLFVRGILHKGATQLKRKEAS